MHLKRKPNIAKGLAIITRRAIYPDREDRRKKELERMLKRFSYIPMYTDYGNHSKYLGHLKVPFNPSVR